MLIERTDIDEIVIKIERPLVRNEGGLKAELEKYLEEEIECDDFFDDTNLFDTPIVDSKSVMKLSPIVEEYIGIKIKPEWIKCGGYDSLEEAVTHLLSQIEESIARGEGSYDV